jgi:hypothetical protein
MFPVTQPEESPADKGYFAADGTDVDVTWITKILNGHPHLIGSRKLNAIPADSQPLDLGRRVFATQDEDALALKRLEQQDRPSVGDLGPMSNETSTARLSSIPTDAELSENELERAQHADSIRSLAADLDDFGIARIRLQVRRSDTGSAVRACLVTFEDGEELVEGGRPVDASEENGIEVLLDETYPTLAALADKQPHVASNVCAVIQGWFQ